MVLSSFNCKYIYLFNISISTQWWILCRGNLSLLYFLSDYLVLHQFQPCNWNFIAGYYPHVSALSWIQNWRLTQTDSAPRGWNLCLSITDEPDLSDRRSHIIPIALLHLCSTLIGWGWSNLPPQTCFLSAPGARSVFLTNYHLPSEMICNMASSRWITIPPAIYISCHYLLSAFEISGGKFGPSAVRPKNYCPIRKLFFETNERKTAIRWERRREQSISVLYC